MRPSMCSAPAGMSPRQRFKAGRRRHPRRPARRMAGHRPALPLRRLHEPVLPPARYHQHSRTHSRRPPPRLKPESPPLHGTSPALAYGSWCRGTLAGGSRCYGRATHPGCGARPRRSRRIYAFWSLLRGCVLIRFQNASRAVCRRDSRCRRLALMVFSTWASKFGSRCPGILG